MRLYGEVATVSQPLRGPQTGTPPPSSTTDRYGDREAEEVEGDEDERRMDPAETREHAPRVAPTARVRQGAEGHGGPGRVA